MPHERRLRWLLTGALVVLAAAGICLTRTLAQAAGTAYLTPPEISEFPRLSAYLDVSDAQGSFVSGLTAADVTMLEDGLELPLIGLQAQRPGVQFVLAITSGSALEIRDGQGHTRYQHLVEGMLSGGWDEQPDGQDDFSLLTPTGAVLLHSSNPAELRSALEAYQLPPQDAPNLEVLAQALEVAADPLPRPGMERAVLFITPPQVTDISAGLETLVARANQQNIHIFIWLVSTADYFGLPGANQLASVTTQTGGLYFAFSGTETVPDLEAYLAPLRPVYRLVYESHVAAAGPHQVSARATLPEGTLVSQAQSFEISLLPPTPALVAPPVLLTRRFDPTSAEMTAAALLPVEQVLTLAVTFPDGYERPLVHSTLIVDGMIAAENTAPPFETFRWDLRGYGQNGLHTLRVEVVDSLGLVGQSAEAVVQITVPSTEQGVVVAIERQRLLLIGLGVLIAGSVLILVLIVGGRIRPQAGGRKPARRRGAASRLQAEKDPVTQPVLIPPAGSLDGKPHSLFSVWFGRAPRHAQPATVQPLAFLTPLVEAGTAELPAPLPLGAETLLIGSDPLQADLVLDDPSVEGLHARLLYQEPGFHLMDAGSTAGTWVNYNPLPPEGVTLVHGDLVHLGRSGFRFTQREGAHRRKPTIQPLEPPA